jgi:hypothetical protein
MARNPAQVGNHAQLFVLYLGTGPIDFPEFTGRAPLLSVNPSQCFQARGELEASVVWWQLDIHACEVFRQTNNPGDASRIVPLAQGEITQLAAQPVNGGPAPNAAQQLTGIPLLAGRYSALKAEVTWTDNTATQRVFLCDIGGGTTLSFCGSHVGVKVAYPQPGFVLPPNANEAQRLVFEGQLPPGLVLDSLVQASAAPAPCAPIGRRAARYTLTRRTTPDQGFLFEIPAGAVEVEIYTDNEPAANVWRWLAGPLGLAPVTVGTINPADRSHIVPGTARWLEIRSAARVTATVAFTLEY